MNEEQRVVTSFQQPLLDCLRAARILPTVVLRSEDEALLLGRLLEAAGYSAVEVLLRDPGAWKSATALKASFPSLVVGMGTLKSRADIEKAHKLGLDFGVSPGFQGDLWAFAEERAFAYLPGFSTASELMAIEARGALCAKFFPAEALGPAYLTQVMAAFPGMSIVPSGGLRQEHVPLFKKITQVICLSGSWMLGGWDSKQVYPAELLASLKTLKADLC